MYLKIYFQDKPLFLCDRIDETLKEYLKHPDTVFIDILNTHSVKTMIHEMERTEIHAGIFLHHDLNELKKSFFKKFTLISASGGIILNSQGNVLLIFRRGRWDLPKGKRDKNESAEECALRECREETGLQQLSIIRHLGQTFHTYREAAHFHLKQTEWYVMLSEGNETPKPQTEEEITEVRWVNTRDLPGYYSKTYPAIAEMLEKIIS
ncbi:MAG: NUDIX domain-containing protein [Chitinophagaceae bacterium]|nr:NUDIX domain-containing protein [Chitinophagaceae bacterium]